MGSFSLSEMVSITRSLGWRSVLNRLAYPTRQRWYEARSKPGSDEPPSLSGTVKAMLRQQRPAPDDLPLGDLTSIEVDDRTKGVVDLHCTGGVLRMEALASDLVRIRLRPVDQNEFPPSFSYALDPGAEWPPVAFEVEDGAIALAIRTDDLTCRVTRSPCRISFLDAQGQLLSEDAGGLGFRGQGAFCQGAFCTRGLSEGEAIYGLGERAFGLNLRGQALEMWNTDPQSYTAGDDPIYLCMPFLIGLHEGRAYGLFFDNPGRARLDLGKTDSNMLRYEADTGELCVYFFAGPTIPAILERYTQLTGRMPLPPRWMLGYQQCRWSYYPEKQVRELAVEFRRRSIPCDAIYLDIHYLDGYRVFTWDPDRFPDPPRLLADLREQGFRTISMIDPGVKVDPGYHVHDEGVARERFCRMADGSLFKGPVWPGQCYFPDFTDPEVRAWWGSLYQPLLDAGLSGFWNDMNEPAIFGGEMPYNLPHHYEGHGANHGEIHNVYGFQMVRASAEGLGRLRPGERVPLISRSGYAGVQRYGLVWTGDNHSTWEHLRLSVSMCLNLGLSGVAFCGPDTGGFASDCDGELLARWTQVGALTPFFRNHSALGTVNQEPWVFGEPYDSICRRWIELRYELLPYIYTAAWQAARSGLPMMRPLALAFPGDERTYDLDDQFLFGDALLAAPVGQPGQRTRGVHLPGGPWYDFCSGERLSGEVEADAPLDRMPLYVRAGTVLPLGPVIQHSDEWPPEALHLHIYPGEGESWFYEDDGHSLDYQAGAFRLTRFVCEPTGEGEGLVVRREVEGDFDPGYERFEVYIHGLEAPPREVLVDDQQVDVTVDTETGIARLSVGPWACLVVM
jgi:alpha-glucosidase